MDKLIYERKKSFWEDSRFHDITFSFEDTDKVLKANKMILTLVSPVFEAMFYGNFEKQDPILIKDIDYKTFKSFLYFIYTENCKLTTLEEVEKLFYVANKYEVVSVEAACERFIIKNIKNYDPEDVLKFAEMFGLKNLEWLSRLFQNHCPNTALPATWVPFQKGDEYPTGMIIAGYDDDGFPIGIGRFEVSRDILPGTLDVKSGTVSVCYCGKAYENRDKFEILCDGKIKWVEAKDGEVKKQSVEGGTASGYETLYIGKAVYKDKIVVGKVHPSHDCLYFPWNEGEYRFNGKYLQLVDLNKKKTTKK